MKESQDNFRKGKDNASGKIFKEENGAIDGKGGGGNVAKVTCSERLQMRGLRKNAPEDSTPKTKKKEKVVIGGGGGGLIRTKLRNSRRSPRRRYDS